MKVSSGSFHFDPNRRQPAHGRSIGEDPDAAAAFQEALHKAAEAQGTKPENAKKAPADRSQPPLLR